MPPSTKTYDVRGARLTFPINDHIGRQLVSGNYYEWDLLEAIKAHNRRGVYVDVGANYGNHTVFFSRECPVDLVVAVEPNIDAMVGLVRNLAANDIHNVMPVHAGISTSRRLRLRPPENPYNSGMVKASASEQGTVLGIWLDELLRPLSSPVAVIKVDTESPSDEILQTGMHIIREHRPIIAAEAHLEEDAAAVDQLLFSLGYSRSTRYCRTPTYIWSIDGL